TGRGCWASTAPIRAVVVVLPLVPVIAVVSASIARQPSSSSPMIGTPRARAGAIWAPSSGTPGLTTTRWAPAKAEAAPSPPPIRRTPRSARPAASRPRAATGFAASPGTSAPPGGGSRAPPRRDAPFGEPPHGDAPAGERIQIGLATGHRLHLLERAHARLIGA